ncbi:group II intron reverse transcriptase/maturase [Hespellia stercorisuis]|uniref:RNA-directed DNA polymerase n=1 Tax=Hespellia stercorisuis DSM 15480 TaxID=1121950 RepID=A0A1M6X7D8_9FIRM|nr:group II intron reverse transcriptase/maturase [Hespellia stercorisuis]SHL01833.1 RNA-directed DNA polymerase [Hespellia stercorisuis DSM 15480]
MNDDMFNDAIREKASRITKAVKWSDIDWKTAYEYVNRLQIRIVKATEKKNWNLVKRLQYLLTNSFYAKALAVKKVTSNRGKRTPGIDNEIWNSDEKKWNAINTLRSVGYKALPTKRIHIPKSNGKKRPLSIPTMRDRAMQTLFCLALQPIEETTADEHSYGFRMNRSCHDACEQIFADLSLKNSAQWVLEGDIKGCFDNISHEWMLNNIPMERNILKQFIKAGFIFQNKLFPTSRGAVQGGAISPTLANLVLDGLEQRIWEEINIGKSGKVVKLKNLHKVHLIRYADDFVITGESKEILLKVKDVVITFMSERGLQLSEEKTLITNIQDGFDFLGWNFRKYNNKLIIKPSKKSIKRFSDSLTETVKHLLPAEQGLLILKLNEKLRGWCNYHSTVCSKEAFKTIDFMVFRKLIGWMKRKHNNKHVHRFYAKYWKTIGKRKNVFTDGKWILVNCSYTPIVRHPKLKSKMNPYTSTEYFDKRAEFINERKKKARKRVAAANPAYV